MSGATDGIGHLLSYLEHAVRQIDAHANDPALGEGVDPSIVLNRLELLEWSTGLTPQQDVFGPDDPPARYEIPGPKVEQPVQGGGSVEALPRTNRCVEAYSAWREYALELESILSRLDLPEDYDRSKKTKKKRSAKKKSSTSKRKSAKKNKRRTTT